MCVTNYARYLHCKNGVFEKDGKVRSRLNTFTSVTRGKDNQPQTKKDGQLGYVKKLREYYASMTPPVADPWSEFWEMSDKVKADGTPSQNVLSTKWNWLAKCIERAWLGRLCEPLRLHDIAAHTGATGTSSPPDAKVRCFRVRSVDGVGDGDVMISTGYKPSLAPLAARALADFRASAAVTAAGSTTATVGPASLAGVVAGVSIVDPDDPPPAKKSKGGDKGGDKGGKGGGIKPPLLKPIGEDGLDQVQDDDDDAALTISSESAASTTTTSGSSGYYYIYSSEIAAQKASKSSSSSSSSSSNSSSSSDNDDVHSTTLSGGSSLDNLVGSLHRRILVLESKPTGDEAVNVVSGDELAGWFEASMAGVLAVSGPGDNSSDVVGAFMLTMNGLPHGQDTGTATLVFRSTPACLGSAFGSDQAALAPAPGIVDGATLLVLGLDTDNSTTLSTSLSRLLAYANVTAPSFLDSLGSTTATLDVATGTANAVWLLPWLHYTTNLRLQFTATGGCDALNSLIEPVLTGFSASSLTVIVRTAASWLPGSGSGDSSDGDGDTVAAGLVLKTGSVALLADCKVTVTVTKDGEQTNVDVKFQAAVKLSTGFIQLTLLPADGTDVLNTILTWLSTISGIQLSTVTDIFTKNNLSSKIALRRLCVTLVSDPSDSTKIQLDAFAVDLQVTLTFGATDSGDSVVFLISFHHTVGQKFGSITGFLWCRKYPSPSPSLSYFSTATFGF